MAVFASPDPAHRSASWDKLPFMQRPFLRMPDGKLLLVHARAR